ncbi:MAG: outer membrane protein assembly factor BamB [Gammaproteobacteria bacterium]|nr:outer membrane protein assembly factor BamB [Gammaproteobacteria bacterium]
MEPSLRLLRLLPLTLLPLWGCATVENSSAEGSPLRVTQRWVQQVGEGSDRLHLQFTPIAVGRSIIAASHQGRVIALEQERGQRLWQRDLHLPLNTGGVVANTAEKSLLLFAGDEVVIALDAIDGEEVWRYEAGGEVITPAVVSGKRALIRSGDGRLIALDVATGKQLWVYRWSVSLLTLRGNSAPVVIDDKVLFGNGEGALIALDLRRGEELWQIKVAIPRGRSELERMVDIDANIVVSGDRIYLTAYGKGMSCYNIVNGRLLWKREVGGESGAAIADSRLYLADRDGVLWSLSADDGSSFWRQPLLRRRHLTPPVVSGNYLIVGDEQGKLHWFLRQSGLPVAEVALKSFKEWFPRRVTDDRYHSLFPDSRAILAPPLVDENRVYAMDQRGVLAAFSAVVAP